MFTESDNLLERYNLASRAGFKNVECAFPYDHSIEAVVAAKKDANVNQILINVFAGIIRIRFIGSLSIFFTYSVIFKTTGESLGFAALPGRQEEFKESLDKSVQYAKALECDKYVLNRLYPSFSFLIANSFYF